MHHCVLPRNTFAAALFGSAPPLAILFLWVGASACAGAGRFAFAEGDHRHRRG